MSKFAESAHAGVQTIRTASRPEREDVEIAARIKTIRTVSRPEDVEIAARIKTKRTASRPEDVEIAAPIWTANEDDTKKVPH